MSYTTDRYIFEDATLFDIVLTACGITVNHPSHACGKLVYQNYSIHFVLEGKGTYICDGKKYQLEKGNGFVIIPGIPCEYVADAEDPWRYIYIGIAGKGAERMLADAGLSKEKYIFDFPLDKDTLRDIELMHSTGKKRGTKGYCSLGYLMSVIGKIILRENPSPAQMWSTEQYVEKAKIFIRQNYQYGISVETVADHIGVDRSYLYRLFVKHEGCSPSRFLCDLRVEMASEKLKNEKLTIRDVAFESGFCDASHFYKAFYAKFNMSPQKYREKMNV